MINVMNTQSWQRPTATQDAELFDNVSMLLREIEAEGDKKIDALSQQFDGFMPTTIALKPFAEYREEIGTTLSEAIAQAATRIERFCQFQRDACQDAFYADESGEYGYVYQPIARTGAYIPGGRFPLISTALMTLLPAKVAGVSERIAVSPSAHPAILAAASLARANKFMHIGGVQAIAALAFGYKDIAPVDVIVGPGNQYVNAAKQLLQYRVGIDVAAGPSELLVLADERANVDWLIADMAAQAEHDQQALSVLVTTSQTLLTTLCEKLSESDELKKLCERQQIVLLKADDREACVRFANDFAAEHLLLTDANISREALTHFGSLFIGDNSAVAFGDYCAGTNHTLPTMGNAKRQSGLSVHRFLTIQSVQTITDAGREHLANIARPIAQAEQLTWHDESMRRRISNTKKH